MTEIKKISVNIPESLNKWIEEKAKKNYMKKSDIIRIALINEIKKEIEKEMKNEGNKT
ncbi:hypothetical protein [Peromfec virus RodF7_13]|uniref:Uncharacterized protein n=1 Tax=Peromfec virus RodF7_13 TaxID=2929348 RepID=A0A976R5J2_9VIRU|nr:hypothetical protein [Peromfec virus RodF7_13]